jgi:hypothetical protein
MRLQAVPAASNPAQLQTPPNIRRYVTKVEVGDLGLVEKSHMGDQRERGVVSSRFAFLSVSSAQSL